MGLSYFKKMDMVNLTKCKPLALILAIVLTLSLAVFAPTKRAYAQSYRPMVSAGEGHTVGLTSYGTVIPLGTNKYGQCTGVLSWTDITQVSAGFEYTVGLKSDGSVVAVGNNGDGQCDVNSWTEIQQVAAGAIDTVGLKSDGTVIAAGYDIYGQCSGINSWVGITQVAAGNDFTVGLKSDGRVIAVGNNGSGQCNVSSWTGITEVAVGDSFTVGLKSDGTVVAVGNNGSGQCNVSSWTSITEVAVGDSFTVGLKSDGTVIAVGNNSNGQCNVGSWTGINQVAAGYYFTIGLRSDGAVVAVGDNDSGQCDVNSWNLMTDFLPTTYTSVISSNNQSDINQPVTFTATVTPRTATGTVQFMLDGKALDNPVALSNGGATSDVITSLAIGKHVITAIYSGDSIDAPSIGLLQGGQIVQRGSTSTSISLTSSLNPSKYGQAITFTAVVVAGPTIAGIMTGTVTFKDGNIVLATRSLNSIGQATLTTSSLLVNSHTITAIYGGNTNFSASTGTITQIVLSPFRIVFLV